MEKEWQERNQDLLKIISKQPYEFEFQGVVVRVGKDVFPPDIGFTTQLLAEVLLQKKASCALDMGTGTLILALLLRKAGIQHVWAVDNHLPAIECARSNLKRNPRLQPIQIH